MEKDALRISNNVALHEQDLDISAIRAQGAGGQNVNKVSSAIHLRFDIRNSQIPDFYKQRLLQSSDSRITRDGVIILKAQQYRTQEMNKQDAIERLVAMIKKSAEVQKKRIATKPTRSSQKRRVDSKKKQGQQKALRKKVSY